MRNALFYVFAISMLSQLRAAPLPMKEGSLVYNSPSNAVNAPNDASAHDHYGYVVGPGHDDKHTNVAFITSHPRPEHATVPVSEIQPKKAASLGNAHVVVHPLHEFENDKLRPHNKVPLNEKEHAKLVAATEEAKKHAAPPPQAHPAPPHVLLEVRMEHNRLRTHLLSR
ncbi:hypothetical protein NMY22_g7807 [Coprinellus aureogranulatus]|nr:hypothetical protein NMY22_g7807 [Coprinellus aureogranulatus]